MTEYNPFSLKGKTILVTGASSGIGKSIAVECLKMGAYVILSGRNEEKLQQIFSVLDYPDKLIITADLTNAKDVENLVNGIPKLDGLVNNAGINKRLLCKDIVENELSRIFSSNFSSHVLLTKRVIKSGKLNKNGSVVFISSRAANRPTIGNAMYSASKGAINAYAKVLALELAPQRIRVNCLQPGMVWTPMLEHGSLSREQYEEDEKRYPLGRYGKPEDVAFSAIYLLSDASCWLTGSSITIDGGISLL
jgi:NAD(P)-dependent dehydrogenase (short-subunit alcohol dehydrogenase family)